MAFITLGISNEILTVSEIDPGGGIELTADQLNIIATSRFGHGPFDYISGEVVLNQERYAIKVRPYVVKQLNLIEQGKINTLAPPHKMIEFLAYAIYIIDNKVDGTSTAAQLTRLANIRTGIETLRAIRVAANTIEDEINISLDPESISLPDHVAWPA